VICEGEKAADAAARFSASIVTTSSAGAPSGCEIKLDGARWRRILIWPGSK